MSQRVVTDFVNSNIPDSFPNQTVKSNPVGLGSSGIVVIIGEADGGPSYQSIVLANNKFTPNQLAKVQSVYLSGQIVDAMQALAAPSNDSDITGTANAIFIVKTNQGTKASAIVDTDYGTLSDKNWGLPGNKYKYQITSIAAEVAPEVSGGTIPALGAALNGQSFTVRLNGGAVTVVTLSNVATDHDTIPHLVAELNSKLPVGVVASAGVAPTSIKLDVSPDVAAYRKGWGKSLELFDSVPGDLAALGLPAGLSVSSLEPGVEVSIVRPDINLSQTIDVNAVIALSVGYLGTTASLTISSAGMLTTAVTGGSGAGLSINLNQYRTVADLATFIASQTGYSAVVAPAAQQLAPAKALDLVSAIGIASSGAGLMPGRIKKAAADFQAAIANSALSFAASANGEAGLPNPMTVAVFLSGGLRGATQSADIVNALAQAAGIQCNIVIPLFSQDSSKDILAGTTDSASTYSIAAINAATKSHCIQLSTPQLKRHRICILSINDTYANCKSAAQSLGNYRCSLTDQQVVQNNSVDVITTYLPWYGACLAAGMQTGGFYKAIFNKSVNIISYIDPVGFDSGDPGDVSDALSAGLLFMSKDTGRAGYWVSDQTTYGYDTNFVYNSIQAVYCSDLITLDLAQAFKVSFVGKSLADVDSATALSYLAQKMDGYKKLKLIAGSSDAPLGFKNQSVSISGPELDVAVEIKLATAVYFIPINLNFSQVQSAA